MSSAQSVRGTTLVPPTHATQMHEATPASLSRGKPCHHPPHTAPHTQVRRVLGFMQRFGWCCADEVSTNEIPRCQAASVVVEFMTFSHMQGDMSGGFGSDFLKVDISL